MEYVRFGRSNMRISRIGLGAMGFGNPSWRPWVLPEEAASPIIRRAIEAGINFVDTCDFYSAGESETILGNQLWKFAKRDEVVIATKAGSQTAPHVNGRGYSRKHLRSAIDNCLKRLKTDHVDIFQTHVWQPDTDLDEMVDAFDEIVKAGKALYVGATQMPAWTFVGSIASAERRGLTAFASMQCEYNPCHREAERELLPFCNANGLAVVPFSPMARGFLSADRRLPAAATERHRTDDYTLRHYHRPADYAVLDAVRAAAADLGVSPSQVSLAWTLAQRGVTAPIIGATKPEHIDEAIKAISLRMDDLQIASIEQAYCPRSTRGGGH